MSDYDITGDTLIDELYDGNAGTSKEHLAPYGFENDTEKTQSRLETAKEMDKPVFPAARAVYDFADSWYSVNLDAHTMEWGERPACVCPDYVFTAGGAGVDCKHILYVKLLVANGYLPPRDVDNIEDWMEARVTRFIKHLQSEIDQTISTLLSEELEDVQEDLEQELERPRLTDLREVERKVSEAVIE